MDFSLFYIALAGYFLGSIPFGLVLSYAGGYGDVRKIGSGNIGATNVLRTGNKILAFLTLVLDSGKGAAAVLVARLFIGEEAALVAGLFAIIGHVFPVWLKFKGGKGVATTFGMLLAAAPYVGCVAGIIWLMTAFIFRYSSLAALMAAIATPAASYILYDDHNLTGLCAVVTLLVWIKHRANIYRLLHGQEPKIGDGKK